MKKIVGVTVFKVSGVGVAVGVGILKISKVVVGVRVSGNVGRLHSPD